MKSSGIRDSKELSDSQINQLATEIQKVNKIEFDVVVKPGKIVTHNFYMEENTENVNEIELDTREAPVNLNDAVQRCNLVSAPVAT